MFASPRRSTSSLTGPAARSCLRVSFVCFHPAAPCFICLVRVVRLPPLSKHLWAAPGLFCRTLRVQVAEPRSYPRGGGGGLNAPGMLPHNKDGPPPGSLGMQIEYPLVFAAAPPSYSPPCTHIDHTFTLGERRHSF